MILKFRKLTSIILAFLSDEIAWDWSLYTVLQRGNADVITHLTSQSFTAPFVKQTWWPQDSKEKSPHSWCKLTGYLKRGLPINKSKLAWLHSCTRAKLPWALLEQCLKTPSSSQGKRHTWGAGGGEIGMQFQHISLRSFPRPKLSPYRSCSHSWLSTYIGSWCWPSIRAFHKVFIRITAICLFHSSPGEQSSGCLQIHL